MAIIVDLAGLVASRRLVVTMAAVVLGHVVWAAARGRQAADKKGIDRKERWVSAASELLPPAMVRLAAAEMTVIHMALFRWADRRTCRRGPALSPITGT